MTFPKEAQGLLSIFEVFNVNIAKLSLPLSCIGLGTFRQQMLFTMLFPLVIAACIFLGCFVYVMCARTTKDTGMGSMKNIVAEAKKSAIQIAKDDRKSPLKVAGLLALPHLLILSFLVFPMVGSIAFQAFACEDFDNGRSFLRADFSVECGTAEHDNVEALAYLGIVLYPGGVTLLYIGLFCLAHKAIRDEKPTALSRALGFLTLDFEKHFFAWELFEAWKKLFLVGFCVLIMPGTILQLLVAFFFSLLCMLATAVASPFVSDVDDSVAKAFGFALVGVFFVSVVIKVNVLTEAVDDYLVGKLRGNFNFDIVVVSALLTISVAFAMVVTAALALQQLVHAARMPHIKLRSTSGRPALTAAYGITWHLFLSQCACTLEPQARARPHLTRLRSRSQHLGHGARPVRHHQAPALHAAAGRKHFPRCRRGRLKQVPAPLISPDLLYLPLSAGGRPRVDRRAGGVHRGLAGHHDLRVQGVFQKRQLLARVPHRGRKGKAADAHA